MGTSIEFTDKRQRLAGMAPRAVGALGGLGTQRLRAGLTSVAPLALGLGPRRIKGVPPFRKRRDGAPESSRERGVRNTARADGLGVSGSGDFGVGGPGDWLYFLD